MASAAIANPEVIPSRMAVSCGLWLSPAVRKDRWTSVPDVGAPAGRYLHTTVWTGAEMIVWGGGIWPSGLDDGARLGYYYPLYLPLLHKG
jgi:hypothetical protein